MNNATTTDKRKFPAALACAVGEKIVEALRPACLKIEIAGSLRRRKREVGDIEIIYVAGSVTVPNPDSLFGELVAVNAADFIIAQLIERGSIAKRPKCDGSFTWGSWIKLAVAVKTEIPVDFFAVTPGAWFNMLVCRTGGKEMNTRICMAANERGWKWSPSPESPGFVALDDGKRIHRVNSEREVFDFVNLPFLDPEERS